MNIRIHLLGLLLAASACDTPVKRAEAFWRQGEARAAFVTASEALREHPSEEEGKRLITVQILAARKLLQAPDEGRREDVFLLLENLPAGTDEHAKAAQKLLRVMGRSGASDAELQSAFDKLGPEMGDESDVRSNLRLMVEQNPGKGAALWAARTVVQKWPDDSTRWQDLALAQMGLGQWDEARKSLQEAHARLDAFCQALPARMQAYDKVRRLSAYGQFEIKRCQGFPVLAERMWAATQHKMENVATSTTQVDGSSARASPCPSPRGPPVGAPEAQDAGAVLMVSPEPQAWWVDGQVAAAPLVGVSAADHEVLWRDAHGCRMFHISPAAGAAVVIRTTPPPQLPLP